MYTSWWVHYVQRSLVAANHPYLVCNLGPGKRATKRSAQPRKFGPKFRLYKPPSWEPMPVNHAFIFPFLCKVKIFQLVGGWTNPGEVVKLDHLPKVGVKMKHLWNHHLDVSEKSGFSNQIIHFNRVSMIFTIHFGGNTPIFGSTPIHNRQLVTAAFLTNRATQAPLPLTPPTPGSKAFEALKMLRLFQPLLGGSSHLASS